MYIISYSLLFIGFLIMMYIISYSLLFIWSLVSMGVPSQNREQLVRKKWPDWFKVGLIFTIIPIIAWILLDLFDFLLAILIFVPLRWTVGILIPLYGECFLLSWSWVEYPSRLFCTSITLVTGIIFYFIVGATIDWMVGKIKGN